MYLAIQKQLVIEEDVKKIICKTIDNRKDDLNLISQEIWKNSELDLEEHFAHQLLTTFLEKEGFEVCKSYPLETAFTARYGNRAEGSVKIGILCEYHALPLVGHACENNLIAEPGVGTAFGENILLFVNMR